MAKTARKLVQGGGTITSSAGGYGNVINMVFSQIQDFKEGATIYTPSYWDAKFTVDRGYGTTWVTKQAQAGAVAPYGTFYTSDPSTSRARGAGAGWTSGIIIPAARHFVYVSHLDDAGNPDLYTYIDTLFPEKGLHPYTKDRCYGSLLGEQARVCPIGDGLISMVYGTVCPTCGRLGVPGTAGGSVDTTPPFNAASAPWGFFQNLGERLAAMDSMSRVVG
jgi:hypothetical protein